MDQIKHYYSKKIHIQYEERPLTIELRESLYTELKDKTFIDEELKSLLNQSIYLRLSYNKIILDVLPTEYISIKILKKVIKRIYVLTQIYKITIPIHIWLIPSQTKRFFPKDGETIKPEHINGGYTYTNNHTIYVYRYEEFPKVILHEVLHNSILQTIWRKDMLMELYKLLNIDDTQCDIECKTRLQPEEALIEVWALYYQIMFQAHEKKKDCMVLFNKELEWSLYQSKRLLEYHQTYYQDGWKEDTHAYSYIFLKTLFLYYWNDFSKIPMPYTDAKLLKFIKSHLNASKSLQNAIENSKDFNTESFRMTYFGDL